MIDVEVTNKDDGSTIIAPADVKHFPYKAAIYSSTRGTSHPIRVMGLGWYSPAEARAFADVLRAAADESEKGASST